MLFHDSPDWRAQSQIDAAAVALIAEVETAMILARYALMALLGGWLALDYRNNYSPESLVILGALAGHNLFAHLVFYFKRLDLFQSMLSFLMYLGVISLVVSLASPDAPVAAMYLVLIMGYVAYSPVFLSSLSVTVICICAQLASLYVQRLAYGTQDHFGHIIWHTLAIALGGWLLGRLSDYARSSRRLANEHARERSLSEETIRVVLDTTPAPTLVYDESGVITEANAPACHFLGVASGQLRGQHFKAFLTIEHLLTPPEETDAGILFSEAEATVLTELGERKHVQLRLRSFSRSNQQHHVAVFNEREGATAALGMDNSGIMPLRPNSQGELFRNAFVDTVIRRIRSPLTSIAGYIEMLLGDGMGELSDHQRQALQSCRRSLQRIFDMLQEPRERRSKRRLPKGDSPSGVTLSDK